MNWSVLVGGAACALFGGCLAPPDEGVAKAIDAGAIDAVSCPGNYVAPFGKSVYRVIEVGANAQEAEQLCDDEGGHLVVIDEEGENAHVVGLGGGRLWLGLVDEENDGGMTAEWTWVTGAPLGEAVWDDEGDGTPEPDGSGGCVIIDPDAVVAGSWDDTGCLGNTTPRPVCECDGASAVHPIPG